MSCRRAGFSKTDRERFELSIPGSPVCRFSRPVPSTTRPPVLQPPKLLDAECEFNPTDCLEIPAAERYDESRRERTYRMGTSSRTLEIVVVDGSRLGVRYGLS